MRAIRPYYWWFALLVSFLVAEGCNRGPVQRESEKSAGEVLAMPEAAQSPQKPSSATHKASDFRTWTDANGFTVNARFCSAGKIHVTLAKEDGREITVRLSSLSPADRKLAERLMDESRISGKADKNLPSKKLAVKQKVKRQTVPPQVQIHSAPAVIGDPQEGQPGVTIIRPYSLPKPDWDE